MAAQVHHGPIRIDGNPLKSKQRATDSPLRRSSSGILSPTSPPSPRTVTSSHFGRRTERTPPLDYEAEREQQFGVHTFTLPSTQSLVDLSQLRGWDSNAVTTGLSLDTKFATSDRDDFHFPRYDSVAFGHDDAEDAQMDNYEPEPSTTTDTTQSDSPLPTPTISDDTAVKQEPSRHVDYLSHNWREEDIWASWKHIVSQRRIYGQRSRLENASWRTWAKSKNRLRTVPPEKLNWLKESDVTWLYGPLTPALSHPVTSDTSEPQSQISKNSSFINKKPILKKRSMSEAMLQRSISSSSLLKQAAASIHAQQGTRQTVSFTGYGPTPLSIPSQPPSRDQTDYFSSRNSSLDTDSTPGDGQLEKHIRFDEKVGQCIAVESVDGDPSDDEDDLDSDRPFSSLSDSGSDEGLVMKKWGIKRKSALRSRGSDRKADGIRRTNSYQARMIEEIEATTLKSRTDSPDIAQQARHHVFGSVDWSSSTNARKLGQSPSQETLRPSRPSRNFLIGADDDGDGSSKGRLDTGASWSFGAANPKSSLGASSSPLPSPRGINDPVIGFTDGYDGIEGMRRTESGMFMPYDDDTPAGSGLLGRVSETFNTMRDIGHVLYTAFRT